MDQDNARVDTTGAGPCTGHDRTDARQRPNDRLPTAESSRTPRAWALLALAIAAGQSAVGASTACFNVVDIGTLGGDQSYAYAINDTAVIAGSSRNSSGELRAFRWTEGELEDLGTLGGRESRARGLNELGQVVGRANLPGDTRHRGFIARADGSISELDALVDGASFAFDINRSLQVTGGSWAAEGAVHHAVLWDDEELHDLGTLGGPESYGYAIDEDGCVVGRADRADRTGQAFLHCGDRMVPLPPHTVDESTAWDLASRDLVVGETVTAGLRRATLWRRQERVDLGTLGGDSVAYGVNRHEQAVGASSTDIERLRVRAFFWEQGLLYDLNGLLLDPDGWTLIEAWSINAPGDIVGWGERNGQERAFLLRPEACGEIQLEPTTLEPGTVATFSVSGVEAEETVYVLASTSNEGIAACPVPAGGRCLGLAQPYFVVGSGAADPNGLATISAEVPETQARDHLYLQAAVIRGTRGLETRISNLVEAPVVQQERAADATRKPTTGYATPSLVVGLGLAILSVGGRRRYAAAPRTHGVPIAMALVLPASVALGQLTFTEVQDQAGIHLEYVRDAYPGMGAGGAWLDFDRDGWVDLYLTQMDGPNHLYRNDRKGGFVKVDDAAGASDVEGYSYGAVAGDYDNDGDPDLFVTNNGQNRLYRNMLYERGEAIFSDATAAAGMLEDGAAYSTSASWGDYDGDGWLDLYVASYASEFRPDGLEALGTPNYLWHNQGDGTFTSVGSRVGVDVGAANTRDGLYLQPGTTLATTWSDFDGDGDLDILVVNDFGLDVHPNQLFRNDGPDGKGGWIFSDISVEAGFDQRILGMGVAVGDVDNDGDLDYYATNGPANILLLNRLDEGVEGFEEVAAAAGVEAYDPAEYGPEVGPISWGCNFADFDLDGWLDLLVVNGFLDIAAGATSPLQPSFVYRNQGDLTFVELHQSAGLGETELAGRTSGTADYDRDGDVDFFVGSLFRWDEASGTTEPAWYRLYRNDSETDHNWLSVEARGTLGNRDSIGARITVRANGMNQMREVGTGRSFLSSSELTQHFGLGASVRAEEVEVRWLSGARFVERGLPSGTRWVVHEPMVGLDVSLESDAYRPGEPLTLHYRLSNLLTSAQVGWLWLDEVQEDGLSTRIKVSPSIEVRADSELEGTITFTLDETLPEGPRMLALRWGNTLDVTLQQAFITTQPAR